MPEEPVEIGCRSDEECLGNQACRNRKCVNLCFENNPCAKFASCTAANHKVSCECPPGMTGNAYLQCYPSKIFIL